MSPTQTSQTQNWPITSEITASNVGKASATQSSILASLPEMEEVCTSTFQTNWKFWSIMVAMSLAGFCSTLETTIIPIALPTIVEDLGGGALYIWVANAYFLASLATLPLFAQAADIFGRRWPLLVALSLFLLGSGLAGGSDSIHMLITARAVAGIGGGGISLLIEIVVTDLVPLRKRGQYLSAIMATGSIAAAAGPFLGGAIVSRVSWRWVFYINLPTGGLALVLLFAFLRVEAGRDQSWNIRLARIDYGGNFIFIAAISAILIALTWGGPVYSWNNFHIVVPLVFGVFGLLIFIGFEWSAKLAEPAVPRILVSNRTSVAALIMTMLSAVATYWSWYFLPVYFQAVKQKDAMAAGLACLPSFAAILPFAIFGGVWMSKTGRYKSLHVFAWVPMVVGFGLFSLLDKTSSTAMWICFQIVSTIGAGLLASTLLPVVQAPLEEQYVSSATGLWSVFRGFGVIWGVTIPAAVFNNACAKNAFIVSDPVVAQRLRDGHAYGIATKLFLASIESDVVREETIAVFTQSLRTVWLIGIPFAGVGLLVCFLEREIKLRTTLSTEFGLADGKDEKEMSDPSGSP